MNGITILPKLDDLAVKRGFSLHFGDRKVINGRLQANSPIQLAYHGHIVLEISDLSRMYEVETFLKAFELGYKACSYGRS